MPPLQTPGIAYTNPKTLSQGGRPRAACMRPLRTYRQRQVNEQGRCLPQAGHGGVKTPPYRAGEAGGDPANPVRGTPLPGGMYASPTN